MTWWHGLIALWLVVCAVQDLRRRQVGNALTLPVLVVALIAAVVQGGAAILRLGLVGLVLFVLWQKGGLGGADVKICWRWQACGRRACWVRWWLMWIAGLVMVLRRQGRVRYAAVPVMAAGSVLTVPIQILIQGGF